MFWFRCAVIYMRPPRESWIIDVVAGNLGNLPIAIQPVDDCCSGAGVTYRLHATRGSFLANTKFWKPALVVSLEPD